MIKLLSYLLLLYLVGCSSVTQEMQSEEIDNYYATKNYKALIEHYKTMMVTHPDKPELQVELAQAYLLDEDVESAEFYLTKLLDEGFYNAKSYYLLAEVKASNNDYVSALPLYIKSYELDNRSKELYMQLGVAYANNGQYQEAINHINMAREKGYDDLVVKNNLAMVYILLTQYELAIELLTPIYQQQPENKKLQANLQFATLQLQQQDAVTDITNSQDELNQEPLAVSHIGQCSDTNCFDHAQTIDDIAADITDLATNPLAQQHAPVVKRRYAIQLASFADNASAQQHKQQWQTQSLDIRVEKTNVADKGIWYRLLVGNFTHYRQAKDFITTNEEALSAYPYFVQVLHAD